MDSWMIQSRWKLCACVCVYIYNFIKQNLPVLLGTGILALDNHGPLSSLNYFGKQHGIMWTHRMKGTVKFCFVHKPFFYSYQLERSPWATSRCHLRWLPAGNNKEGDWELSEQVWEYCDIWMCISFLLAYMPLSAHLVCSVLSEQKEI